MNLVPREGGNTVRGLFLTAGSSGALQGSNYTQALRDQGLTAPQELQRLWADQRAKYPADFTVSPAAARAWREREIGDCLKEGNLAAAEFHYWWLVAEVVQAAKPAGGN